MLRNKKAARKARSLGKSLNRLKVTSEKVQRQSFNIDQKRKIFQEWAKERSKLKGNFKTQMDSQVEDRYVVAVS